jgi:hypothetical protein
MITSLVYKKKYTIMLKITTLFIAILFATQTNAQIKKGKVLLGGQAAAGTSKSNIVTPSTPVSTTEINEKKSSLFGINIGTAYKENKVIGISFITSKIKETRDYFTSNSFSGKTNQYEIGVYYRQYKKFGKDFYFYGQADLSTYFGGGTGVSNPNTYTRTIKENGSKLYVTTAISYSIFKKLQIELSLPNIIGLRSYNYKFTTSTPNDRTENTKQFSFNSSLTNGNVIGNLNIGFRLIL